MVVTKEFLVVRKSENTNSFGLFQMFLMAEDGETYKSCASMYNVKEVGETVLQNIVVDTETDKIVETYFTGHELTELIMHAPQDVIDEVFKLKK